MVDKMRKKIEKHQPEIELFNLIFQIIFQKKNLDRKITTKFFLFFFFFAPRCPPRLPPQTTTIMSIRSPSPLLVCARCGFAGKLYSYYGYALRATEIKCYPCMVKTYPPSKEDGTPLITLNLEPRDYDALFLLRRSQPQPNPTPNHNCPSPNKIK